MASIHSKNTKPELLVRHFLWSNGFRYRLNLNRLPGHPDIVLRKYSTCVFVNGCFWHGHNCSEFRKPMTNVDYWMSKIKRNKERDMEEYQQLSKMGWHVIVIWECELKKNKCKMTLESLAFTLNHIYLHDREIHYCKKEEELNIDMVAETKE